MQTRYKYIHFDLIKMKPKTQVWGCFNNSSDGKLGEIKWYGPWRQYCFFPFGETVFNMGCLTDINHFIKLLVLS